MLEILALVVGLLGLFLSGMVMASQHNLQKSQEHETRERTQADSNFLAFRMFDLIFDIEFLAIQEESSQNKINSMSSNKESKENITKFLNSELQELTKLFNNNTEKIHNEISQILASPALYSIYIDHEMLKNLKMMLQGYKDWNLKPVLIHPNDHSYRIHITSLDRNIQSFYKQLIEIYEKLNPRM